MPLPCFLRFAILRIVNSKQYMTLFQGMVNFSLIPRIETSFTQKFGSDSVIILKESKPIQREQLEEEKVYIQITNVEPFEEDGLLVADEEEKDSAATAGEEACNDGGMHNQADSNYPFALISTPGPLKIASRKHYHFVTAG